jgi:hypothetical protein
VYIFHTASLAFSAIFELTRGTTQQGMKLRYRKTQKVCTVYVNRFLAEPICLQLIIFFYERCNGQGAIVAADMM